MNRLSEIYTDLESMHIGESERTSEMVKEFDIDEYSAVSHEHLAGLYGMDHGSFSGTYFGNVRRGENELPAIQDKRPAYHFVVTEDKGLYQITDDKTYAAGIGSGEIEVRDEELWQNEVFQEVLSEWSEWRDDQNILGTFDTRDLKIHKNF
ncbi:MAG: hypothetical protein BRC29_03320 [Nanohaloarchaea archaeon SW_7_43_1]|nr:MAG: hypothetical protein BRC29_03320 [Nanohaloarchaea archaeon SW_7_43_1]